MNAERFPLVASKRHTVRFIVIWAAITALMTYQASKVSTGHPAAPGSHVPQYLVLIVFEWALFWFARAGMRAHGTPIASIMDAPDRPRRNLLLDAALGVGFLLVSGVVLEGVKRAIALWSPGQAQEAAHTQAMVAPHGALEIVLWIALSVSAGFCEEFVFRGYFQRQFTALARRASIGLIASAVLFGVGHAYQGWRSVVTIIIFGLLFGLLAHLSRSLRPGIIAHALQDITAGLARH